jgi:hypothetical protein
MLIEKCKIVSLHQFPQKKPFNLKGFFLIYCSINYFEASTSLSEVVLP